MYKLKRKKINEKYFCVGIFFAIRGKDAGVKNETEE